MRISGGEWRGRSLRAPKGLTTRPTSDFLRQAIFNLLGARVQGARVLDLFAGCGALGLEALSRGAAEALFVEQDRQAVAALGANLAALGAAPRGRLVAGEALRSLAHLARTGEQFDCVLLDPPYGGDLARRALEALASGDVLSDNASLLVQAFHKQALPETPGCLRLRSTRRHGETCLSLYTKEPACL